MTLAFNDQIGFTTPSKIRCKTYILIDDKPYQIIKTAGPIVTSKHGSAKYIFDALQIGNNKKKIMAYRSHDKVPMPILERMDLQLLNIEDDEFMTLMTLMTGDDRLFEGVPVPKNALGELILKKFTASQQLVITIKGFKDSYEISGYKEEN
jgi:translation elongation factor P/translation initiation factor 5A